MKRRPQLLPDWRDILRHAWSIRLLLVAGILSGCEVALSAFGSDWMPVPRWVSALVVMLVTMGALVARLLAQKGNDER